MKSKLDSRMALFGILIFGLKASLTLGKKPLNCSEEAGCQVYTLHGVFLSYLSNLNKVS